MAISHRHVFLSVRDCNIKHTRLRNRHFQVALPTFVSIWYHCNFSFFIYSSKNTQSCFHKILHCTRGFKAANIFSTLVGRSGREYIRYQVIMNTNLKGWSLISILNGKFKSCYLSLNSNYNCGQQIKWENNSERSWTRIEKYPCQTSDTPGWVDTILPIVLRWPPLL